jgi:hypothetical protein
MIRTVKVDQREYKFDNVTFSKPDQDGDIQITIEDSQGSDICRWISLEQLESMVAWAKGGQ